MTYRYIEYLKSRRVRRFFRYSMKIYLSSGASLNNIQGRFVLKRLLHPDVRTALVIIALLRLGIA